MNVIINSIDNILKTLIDKEYKQIEEEFNKSNNRIHHTNIYHKDWTTNRCETIINILSNKYYINTNNLISLGFISGQPGCADQHFHVDYDGITETYFIPLCELTDKNGTEYLEFINKDLNIKHFDLIRNISDKYNKSEQVIEQLKANNIQSEQYCFKIANSPAYSLIHLPNYVLHRGRRNNENYNKVMFQIVLAAVPNANISSNVNFLDSELDEDPKIIKRLIESRYINEN